MAQYWDDLGDSYKLNNSSGFMDIGGAMSDTAMVACELGLPCVVDTRIGTSSACTGAIVRVDGNAGKVDILKRRP